MTSVALKQVMSLVLAFLLLIEIVEAIFEGQIMDNLFTSINTHLDHSNKIPTPHWTDCSKVMELFEQQNFTILTTDELVILDNCLEKRIVTVLGPPPKITAIFLNTKRLDRLRDPKSMKCMKLLRDFVNEEHVNVAARHLEPCETDLMNEYASLIKCTRLFRATDKFSKVGGNYFEVILSYVVKTMSMCLVNYDSILEKDFRQVEDVHGNMLDKVTNALITKVHLLNPIKFLVSTLTGQEDTVSALQVINKVDFKTSKDRDRLMKRIRRFVEEMYNHNLAKDNNFKPLLRDDLSMEENEINLRKAYEYSVKKLCSPLVPFEFDTIFDRYITLFKSDSDVMDELHLDLNRFIQTVNNGAYFKPIYYSTRACIFLFQNTIALKRTEGDTENKTPDAYFESLIDQRQEQDYQPIDLASWP